MMRLLCLLFGLLMAGMLSCQAVEIVGSPEVKVTGQAVTLQWKTDVACRTRVLFGPLGGAPKNEARGEVTATHQITLNGLKDETAYRYQLGSAKEIFYEGAFKTGAKGGAVALPSPPATPGRSSTVPAPKPGFANRESKPAPDPAASSQPARAPPAAKTWGRLDTLRDHYERHGADFQSKDQEDYAAKAWLFLQRARAGEVLMKWDDADETLRVYDPKTRAFAAYNRDGRARTYFRPNSPTYWQRQPGRPIRPEQLPFK